MNFTDKIKSIFAPKQKTVTMMAGNGISYPGYAGNSYGNGAKYNGGLSSSRLVNIHDHLSIRQNVRDAMYDSNVARGIVERYADSVVDVGLKLKPTPMTEIIGITPEDGEQWAENVAQKFHLWASSKKSHRSRINNFYQNQRLYNIFQTRDNDIFTRLYYSREKDLSNPLQIDFLDPNQIRGYAYTSSYAQLGGDDGIIRDSGGRETGYKIWNYNGLTGEYTESTIPAVGEKSGRLMMIHGFNPEYAGQGRGYSPLAHAIADFEKITDFSASTIQKAINQASFVMAVENDEKDPSNPVAGRVAGPLREYGTPSIVDTQPIQDATTPAINYQTMPEATITAPGSTGIFNLRRGDKLKYLQDTSPSSAYNVFLDSFCSYLCASTGMPLEILLMKFNANYSASRATLILFWRICQIKRDEMNADFNNPIYEMWLSEEIAAGRISAPGWSDPVIRDAWLCAEWAGAPMPSIDPLKSMQSAKLAVELGAETLDDVAREHNNSSGKANRAKIARQYEELPPPAWGWANKSNTSESNIIKDKEEKEDDE